ncbi:carboxypeptidase regulatory-like domain-containing protein [Falsibacillus albus]|uniref:DUF11 domain-containing protein n=1 Tax=Falsibacillus albus TaxID=2478915 RepID=A0A3L7JSM9_9BACI|nr:carboxypeptidase regulatory-like domain-containing protein [Falsibacillus albus]RLQ93334.1 hypothetical protein D9X91_17890 [Falsibacillus albus]
MAFPSNTQYLPILVNGSPLFDHTDDESPRSTDIVGDSTYPAAFFAYDGTNVYFRLRLNEDPRNNKLTGFQNFSWGVLINTTGVAGTYNWLFNVNGLNSTVNLIKNTTIQVNSWNDPAEGLGGGEPNFSQAISNYNFARVVQADSSFGGNPDYFLDWFLPAATFFSTLGINSSSLIKAIFFSSTNANNYNKDSLRTDEGFSFSNALSDSTSADLADVRAKLTASKMINSGPASVLIGEQASWTGTLTLNNTGKSSATTIIVQDTIGLDTVGSFNVTSTSKGTAVYNPASKILTWNVGNLDRGASAILTFSASGLFSAAGSRPLDTAFANGVDSFTGNSIQSNNASASIPVVAAGSVTGKVLDQASGLPLSGANVELLQGVTVIATTTSDTSGIYSFTSIAPGSYNVRASNANYSNNTVSITVVSGQATNQNILLTPLPGTIQGTVMDNGSIPIAGAQVNLLNAAGVLVLQSTTAANGTYSFSNLTPQNYTVTVSQTSYQSQQKSVIVDPNETETVDFTLDPLPTTITGTIFASGGGTVGGATVEILNLASQVIATTVADGSGFYTVNGLAPGSYRLRASASGYITAQVGFTASGGTMNVDLTLLQNPGSISGGVQDSSTGSGIQNANIRIVNNSGVTVATTMTDASGNYSIPSLSSGSYTVIFTADGYANKAIGAMVASGTNTNVNAQLSKLAGAISGNISAGGPVANAIVGITLNNIVVATTSTDANGNYFVGNLAPNVYNVIVNAQGYARQTLAAIVVTGQTAIANFTLTPDTGILNGTVVDALSNVISGAVISVYQQGGTGSVIARVITQTDGTYTVPNLEPGSFTVIASKDGYQSMSMGAIISAGTTSTVNFQLAENPGGITGIITDALTTQPISGAGIEVRILDSSGTVVQSTFSDQAGHYMISNLAPGTYTAVASASGYQIGLSDVVIQSNTAETINFALYPDPGSIQGRIYDNNNVGQGIAGASVSLTDSFGSLINTVLTDSNGNYFLGGVTPGFYTLNVSAQLFETGIVGVQVQSDATTPVDIGLESTPGTISGLVSPIAANTVIQVFNVNNVLVGTTVAGPDGSFQFSGISAGNYIVTAAALNYSTGSAGVYLPPGGSETVSIEIMALPASVSGNIFDGNGHAIPNATIIIQDENQTIVGRGFSDDNGNYYISSLPSGALTVQASAPYYSSKSTGVLTTPGSDIKGIDFELTADPGSIAGEITDILTGNPISGATVIIRNASTNQFVSSTVSSVFGNYVVNNLPPGSYYVIASANNFGSAQIGAIVTSNQSTIANISLSPNPGSISGAVQNLVGNPITGNNIQITLLSLQNTPLLNTVANSDGTFTLPDIEPGNYFIKAAVSGYNSMTTPISVSSGIATNVTLRLEAVPVTIKGTIVDGLSMQGIPGAALIIFNDSGLAVGNSVTGQDGTFQVNGLPYGTLTLTASAQNYGSNSVSVFTNPGDIVSTQLILTPNPGSLMGYVTNMVTGEAVVNAVLQVVDNTDTIVATVQSDSFGEYMVSGLNPGTYTVVASAVNYGPQTAGAQIQSNSQSILGFALAPDPGYIEGTVRDQVNPAQTIPGATIVVREMSATGPIVFSTITDQAGMYRTIGLNESVYIVVSSAPDYGTIAQGVNVLSNQTVTADFELPPQPGEVSGNVTDAVTYDGLPNSLVKVIDAQGTVVQTVQTAASGFYHIGSLVPGSYTVTAVNADYQSNQKQVTIVANATSSADIPLQPQPSVLNGLITEEVTTVPIVGAAIELYFSGTNILAASGQTDGSGSYTIQGLQAGSYTITASYPGYASRTIGVVVPVNSTIVQNMSLPASPADISGNIQDAVTMSGILGASISVVVPGSDIIISQTLTDVNGDYLLAMIPAGTYNIVVSASDYNSVISSITLQPGDYTTYDASLEPFPGSISGVVSDDLTTAQITNALVQVFFDGSGPLISSTYTDVSGNYTIGGLPEGDFNVVFSADGYGSQRILFNLVPGEAKVINAALLPNPATLTGIVKNDVNHTGLSGALVQVFDQGSNVLISSTLTDSNGIYTIAGLSEGNYRIVYSATDFQAFTTQVIVAPGDMKSIDVSLTPDPASVEGNIKDASTNLAILNARVDLIVPNTDIIVQSAFTNENGDYMLPNLPTGSFTVVISATGYASAAIPVILAPNTTTTVNASLLDTPAQIQGQVTDQMTMNPIQNALVQVYSISGGALAASQYTDDFGQYNITTLKEGQYQVVISASGYTSFLQNVSLSSGGSETIDAALQPEGSIITGKVLSSGNGEAIFGALVQVFLEGTTVPVDSDISDNDGTYTIIGLPPGTYTIVSSAPGFGQQTFNLSITDGETRSLNISLQPSLSSISGTVTDSVTTSGIEGAAVRLVVLGTGIIISTVYSDQIGAYLIDNIHPGSYQLVFNAPGYSTEAVPVTLNQGDSLVVDASLDPTGSTISGTVTDSGSNPVQGALVQIFDAATHELVDYSLTDQNGNYSLKTIPNGQFNVKASASGFITQTIQTTIPPDQTVNFQLEGNPSAVEGRIVNNVTNRPIQGALIQVFLQGSQEATASYLTDPQGLYLISGLSAGTYVIEASAEGYISREFTVIVGDGETVLLNIRLNPIAINLCQLDNLVSLDCILTDSEGNEIEPERLSYEELGRGDFPFILPSGERAELQRVFFSLGGYIQFVLVTTGTRCVSVPIPFKIMDDVIVCAPKGTSTELRIDSFSCQNGLVCRGSGNARNGNASVRLRVCAGFYSTASAVIGKEVMTCAPRDLLNNVCGKMIGTSINGQIEQFFGCFQVDKVYDWIQLDLTENISLDAGTIVFQCGL